jgi:hypothetical protein
MMDAKREREAQSGLRLTRAHSNLANAHFGLQGDIIGASITNVAPTLTRTLAEFEALSVGDRGRLLQSRLTSIEGDNAVCEWHAGRYDHLARMSSDAASALVRRDTKEPAAAVALCANALLLLGHAIKWRQIADLQSDPSLPERVLRMFMLARQAKLDTTPVTVAVERTLIETTVEALFLRTLLVDRFSSGNLIPRRFEILDTWLLASAHALWLSKEPMEGGANFCVDPRNASHPLTPYQLGDVAPRYLQCRPLQRQLQAILGSFHRGRIFPGWGLGMTFRLEDHVGVIDFLDREFSLLQSASRKKSKRLPVGGDRVELFAGYDDIYLRALAGQLAFPPAAGRPGGSAPMTGLGSLSAVSGETGRFANVDTISGPVKLLDVSDAGLGLEMSADDAARLDLENMVAVKLDPALPCVLGIVARKANVPRRNATLVGIKVLSRTPLRATLGIVTDRSVGGAMKGIFVPSDGGDWSGDSIIVTDSTYRANATMNVAVANSRFHIRLGHVRLQGPGWKMTSMQVLVAH